MGKELIVRDPAKLQEWAGLIEECHNSGETVNVWCIRKGINPKTYYYWNKRVNQMAEYPAFSRSSFYEVPHVYDRSCGKDVVSTVTVGTARADIYRGADAETLTALLKAMQLC